MTAFRIFLVLFKSLVFFAPSVSQARWADLEDAPAVVKEMKWHYYVKKDGSFRLRIHREIEILKEAARADYGMVRLTFDPVLEKFKVLKAEVINGKQRTTVHKSNIEIKPLASSGPGFNERQQVTIVFPDTNVGSRLILTYEKEELHPAVPGLFSEHFMLAGEPIENFKVEISSDIPLNFKFNDPDSYLSVSAEPKKISYSLKKPYFRKIVDEQNAHFKATDYLWIATTSIAEISELPINTLKAYQKEIDSPLPASFEKVLAQAKLISSSTQQIDYVTSSLADLVRYVGDWRAVRSGYHPRSLNTIAASGYGDCKDFSVAAGAILSKLGYTAHASWIWRGQFTTFSPLDSPALDVNHAILYLRKGSDVFWIDPTNRASYAKGIFPDIADRPVIILNPSKPFFSRTHRPTAADGVVEINSEIDLSEDGTMTSSGTLELKGSAALPWAGSQLSSSKKSLDHSLIRWVANADNLVDWNLNEYDLHSRLVQDLKFQFKTKEIWRPIQTSAGMGIMIPGPYYHGYFRFQRNNRQSGVRLDTPLTLVRNLKIRGRPISLKTKLECLGETPWAGFEKKVWLDQGTLHFQDRIAVNLSAIEADSIPSLEFEKFQNSILLCLQESVMILK